MVNPFRFQLSEYADDPFALKSKSKLSPSRVIWTMQSRALENFAQMRHKSASTSFDVDALEHHFDEEGESIEDTAVTDNHLKILELAAKETASLSAPIVEIGAYRGVTTKFLASDKSRHVIAVDPFIGYGGAEDDFAVFKTNTDALENVTHKRTTSGTALKDVADESVSMVFVDAVHDVSNSWFDSVSWSRKIKVGGILAMHDVDDHAGSGLSGRHFVRKMKNFTPWAYAPNILCLKRNA